ncbi:SCO family protein [Sphingomonas sp. RP10(2022)]|uniref:SCO family protein n=1 Tax=Sphingomonas liriopis TaxID=2949094 RepID=A0A9X2HV02_9SPHN|nr:SCO family protein [Sphingomonas liriopis]MCP3734074.1 SCO family protein [Sphingomonas liriopis]
MNILRFAPIAAIALAACHPAATEAPPLAGARIGGPFTLTNQDGRTVTDRDFAGQYRIMYFGYTYCPDVCPTDAAAIGKALAQIDRSDPELGRRIVPIFVTVDPERDTPAVLKAFVANFHPRMVGLTGTPAQIAAVSKAFAVFAGKGEAQPGGGYLMNHSRTTYLMDPDGKPLALLPSDKDAQAVAAEIGRWAK